jgi:hypothetical protein
MNPTSVEQWRYAASRRANGRGQESVSRALRPHQPYHMIHDHQVFEGRNYAHRHL